MTFFLIIIISSSSCFSEINISKINNKIYVLNIYGKRFFLNEETKMDQDYEYIKCTRIEGKDALLHRYVAGSAPGRYQKLNSNQI